MQVKVLSVTNMIKLLTNTKPYWSITRNEKNKLLNPTNVQKTFQKKINKREELKLDELDQYNRRQNLEFNGVPSCNNEDVNQIAMDLTESLNV